MRRSLNQLAHAAVRKRDCYLQLVFQRFIASSGAMQKQSGQSLIAFGD
jgi:hypothetical protein